VATLTLNEGNVNTAAGSFTIALAASASGVRDAVGNQASFAGTAVVDKAGPVAIAVTDTNGATDGKFEQNDTMTVTFSEPIIGVPTSTIVSLVGGNGSNNDSLSMSSLFSSGDLGRTDYITGNGSTATFNSSTVSQPAANQIKVSLAACTGACGSITTAAAAGNYDLTPVGTITDAAGNAAVGQTFTIRLF
jgi:hypothetical protein